MRGPHRGFVELPRDVFESLQAVAECVVAEAVKRATPPARVQRPSRMSLHEWERVFWTVLKMDGFNLVQCERSELAQTFQIGARHECGSWCVVVVSDLALVKAESVPERARRLFDRFGCYCVRGEK